MKLTWQRIQPYILYFILYAMLGWLYEVFLEVVVYHWGYSDRGVLFGPWCPIYGVGALTFLLCFRPLMLRRDASWMRWAKPVLIFLGCMVVATAIELAASYLLEACIGSWPWQTYRDYAINFQGRIALSPSIRFGLGGLLFLYGFQPLFERLIHKLTPHTCSKAANIVLAVLLLDCIATIISLVV